jgi:hypothetical protein
MSGWAREPGERQSSWGSTRPLNVHSKLSSVFTAATTKQNS